MKRRSTTSPSTRWSNSRGGYWIGGEGFNATGGSSEGGTSLVPPSRAGAGFPQAQQLTATSTAIARRFTTAPPAVSSRRQDGSAPRLATACSRPARRARRAPDAVAARRPPPNGPAARHRAAREAADRPRGDLLPAASAPARP